MSFRSRFRTNINEPLPFLFGPRRLVGIGTVGVPGEHDSPALHDQFPWEAIGANSERSRMWYLTDTKYIDENKLIQYYSKGTAHVINILVDGDSERDFVSSGCVFL